MLANGISNHGAHDLSGTRLLGINASMSRSGHGSALRYVRYWHKADIPTAPLNVRYWG